MIHLAGKMLNMTGHEYDQIKWIIVFVFCFEYLLEHIHQSMKYGVFALTTSVFIVDLIQKSGV